MSRSTPNIVRVQDTKRLTWVALLALISLSMSRTYALEGLNGGYLRASGQRTVADTSLHGRGNTYSGHLSARLRGGRMGKLPNLAGHV